MPSGPDEGPSSEFRPLEIAFPDGDIPESGTLITFSPASHHSDLLPLDRAIELYQEASNTQAQGRGMFTAREIIAFAYQLKDDYGDRVKTGVFAQITTPTHEAHPKAFIFGFAMAAVADEFTFPNAVQQNIAEKFDNADWVQTNRHQLVVITDDYALHEQIVEDFLSSGIQEWTNTDSKSPV